MLDLNKAAGMVPNASEHGYAIDHMLQYCHWFMAVLFVGWTIYFLYTIFRFHRSRNPKADYHGVQSKASAHLEFSVVLIEAVLLLGFGLPLWGIRVTEDSFPKADDRVEIRAVAEQFLWNFHYPGADGVFGSVRPDFVSANNPLGLDPNDPAGKDDLVVKNEFHLPEQKPVKVEITSKDVIHGFQIQHMRISQDAIPGSRVPVWFKPIRTGEYELVCSQLCGYGHFAMRGILKVDTKADYEAWLKETNALQHPGAAAPAPAAAAPAAPAAK
jgi:cytochrome c oxidase subunit II